MSVILLVQVYYYKYALVLIIINLSLILVTESIRRTRPYVRYRSLLLIIHY